MNSGLGGRGTVPLSIDNRTGDSLELERGLESVFLSQCERPRPGPRSLTMAKLEIAGFSL